MGHQSRNHKESKNNYPSGDNSGGQTYLSLLPRVISSGIINPEFLKTFGTSLAIFSTAFFIALLTSSSFAPVQNSSAETVTTNIDGIGYYVTVSAHDVELDLTSTPAGAVAFDKDTVTVATNCPSGFKLFVSSNSATAGSNYMYYDEDDDYYLLNTTGTTATNNLKALDTNSWGYTLLSSEYGNTGSITSSSNFVGLPLLGNENLIRSTNSANTTGVNTDVYFGVKANTALPSGSYVGTVAYTVFAEATDGQTEQISVSPAVVTTGDIITIATPLYTDQEDLGPVQVTLAGMTCANPTRIANVDTGLISLTCTVPAMVSNGFKTVGVRFYKYGISYELTNTTDTPFYYISWDDLAYMQDMTANACNDADEATASNYAQAQKVLTDKRDNNTYIVRKLKDGNCWMTENLRTVFKDGKIVDSIDSTKTTDVTDANTDLQTQTSWAGGGTTSTTRVKWYNTYGNEENITGSYTYGNAKDDLGDDPNQYKGVLYNWILATAGKGIYNSGGNVTIEDSICPRGWMLPGRPDSNKSFQVMTSGAASILLPPYSFIRAGNHNGSTGVDDGNHSGQYLTSSTHADSGIIGFSINSSGGWSTGNYAKGLARSVRCVNR